MVSRSWANGAYGWDGYIPPKALPRIVNPASGFIVNANQRMLDMNYPHVIGHDFDTGYRAQRISERLAEMNKITEQDLLHLQLDTQAEFYRDYQRLALSLLDTGNEAAESSLRISLNNWDGLAERESVGLAVLIEFRRLLLDTVIAPFMVECRRLDPAFRFYWGAIDEPLQQLLEAKLPELLPDKARYRDWDTFLHSVLKEAERNTRERYRIVAPKTLAWGKTNQVVMAHPFSTSLPWLQGLLDMPQKALAGCPVCVRWHEPGGGASERMVVSPGKENTGILHMPGGQSGHPLSPHYRDQQPAWLAGQALPFLSGSPVHRLNFLPAK